MKAINLGIVGASGMVGRKLLDLLAKRDFPINKLSLFGKSTVGESVLFGSEEQIIQPLNKDSFNGLDLTIFSAGSSVARKFCYEAINQDNYVIDLSSAFRYQEDVPLIVPEINGGIIDDLKQPILIANPNCTTAQLLMALKPIHDLAQIDHFDLATYQAVSGTGKAAVEELRQETFSKESTEIQKVYPKQIAFNAIPQCDIFLDDYYTKEEMKVVWETQKIMDPKITVNATCVRVPVFNGHSEAVFIKTKNFVTREEVLKALNNFNGVTVIDNPDLQEYPTPIEHANDTEEVYVGRVRSKDMHDHGLISLWIVADNVYGKGAALNAIQIAERLLNNNSLKRN